MKILYLCAVFIGGFFALVWVIGKIAEDTSVNYYTPERGYIEAGIRKVEIDNKYVCFVLYDHHAISCLQKEGD